MIKVQDSKIRKKVENTEKKNRRIKMIIATIIIITAKHTIALKDKKKS